MSGDTTEDVAQAINSTVEQIWCGALGVPPGASEQTFLDLGGQSISAVLIATRLKDELGVGIEVDDLFDDPTLASLQEQVRLKYSARS
ncbi:acyl carrier protein [Micromonospora sp. KC723]|uniref:acyl carrier protein n=1 Tax=Micromonospora sp. KC723 TaxID=2530381 RepID=UPI001048E8AB|nr:acyl carrier protein [Micromonospora sp. KC723]TDB76413.1 acyl carrier protein [Micromonospora sp. KC723]